MVPFHPCTAISKATNGGRIHKVNQTRYEVAVFDLGLQFRKK